MIAKAALFAPLVLWAATTHAWGAMVREQGQGGFMYYYTMHPPPKDSPVPKVPPNTAVVVNFGSASLAISYWDGEKNWQSVSIAPGGQGIISCGKCGEEIEVAFDNGKKQNQTEKISKGSAYGLYWSDDTNQWSLLTYDWVRELLKQRRDRMSGTRISP